MEILRDKGASLSKVIGFQKKGINKLSEEAENQGVDSSDISKLRCLLDCSHSDSHAWSQSDTSRGGLNQGIINVQSVYQEYL